MKVYVVFEWSGGYEDQWSEFIDIFNNEEDAKKCVDKKNKEYQETWNLPEENPFYYEDWSVK